MKWIKKKIDRGPLRKTIEEELYDDPNGTFIERDHFKRGQEDYNSREITDVTGWKQRHLDLEAAFLTRNNVSPEEWFAHEQKRNEFYENTANALGVKDEFGIKNREREILNVLTSIFDQNAKFTTTQALGFIDDYLVNNEEMSVSLQKWINNHRQQIAETFSSAVDKKDYNSATTSQDFLNALYDDANASVLKGAQKRMNGESPLLEETLEEAERPEQSQHGKAGQLNTIDDYAKEIVRLRDEFPHTLPESSIEKITELGKEVKNKFGDKGFEDLSEKLDVNLSGNKPKEYIEKFRGHFDDVALMRFKAVLIQEMKGDEDDYVLNPDQHSPVDSLSVDFNDDDYVPPSPDSAAKNEYNEEEESLGTNDATSALQRVDDIVNSIDVKTADLVERAAEDLAPSAPSEEYEVPKQKKSVDEYLTEFKNKVEAGNLTDEKIEDLMGLVQSAQKDWTQKKIPAKIAGLLGLKKQAGDAKPLYQLPAKTLLPRIREELERIAKTVVKETKDETTQKSATKGRKARQETTQEDFSALANMLKERESNDKDAIVEILERFRKDLGKGVVGLRKVGKQLGLKLDSRVNAKDAEEAIAEYVAQNGAGALLNDANEEEQKQEAQEVIEAAQEAADEVLEETLEKVEEEVVSKEQDENVSNDVSFVLSDPETFNSVPTTDLSEEELVSFTNDEPNEPASEIKPNVVEEFEEPVEKTSLDENAGASFINVGGRNDNPSLRPDSFENASPSEEKRRWILNDEERRQYEQNKPSETPRKDYRVGKKDLESAINGEFPVPLFDGAEVLRENYKTKTGWAHQKDGKTTPLPTGHVPRKDWLTPFKNENGYVDANRSFRYVDHEAGGRTYRITPRGEGDRNAKNRLFFTRNDDGSLNWFQYGKRGNVYELPSFVDEEATKTAVFPPEDFGEADGNGVYPFEFDKAGEPAAVEIENEEENEDKKENSAEEFVPPAEEAGEQPTEEFVEPKEEQKTVVEPAEQILAFHNMLRRNVGLEEKETRLTAEEENDVISKLTERFPFGRFVTDFVKGQRSRENILDAVKELKKNVGSNLVSSDRIEETKRLARERIKKFQDIRDRLLNEYLDNESIEQHKKDSLRKYVSSGSTAPIKQLSSLELKDVFADKDQNIRDLAEKIVADTFNINRLVEDEKNIEADTASLKKHQRFLDFLNSDEVASNSLNFKSKKGYYPRKETTAIRRAKENLYNRFGQWLKKFDAQEEFIAYVSGKGIAEKKKKRGEGYEEGERAAYWRKTIAESPEFAALREAYKEHRRAVVNGETEEYEENNIEDFLAPKEIAGNASASQEPTVAQNTAEPAEKGVAEALDSVEQKENASESTRTTQPSGSGGGVKPPIPPTSAPSSPEPDDENNDNADGKNEDSGTVYAELKHDPYTKEPYLTPGIVTDSIKKLFNWKHKFWESSFQFWQEKQGYSPTFSPDDNQDATPSVDVPDDVAAQYAFIVPKKQRTTHKKVEKNTSEDTRLTPVDLGEYWGFKAEDEWINQGTIPDVLKLGNKPYGQYLPKDILNVKNAREVYSSYEDYSEIERLYTKFPGASLDFLTSVARDFDINVPNVIWGRHFYQTIGQDPLVGNNKLKQAAMDAKYRAALFVNRNKQELINERNIEERKLQAKFDKKAAPQHPFAKALRGFRLPSPIVSFVDRKLSKNKRGAYNADWFGIKDPTSEQKYESDVKRTREAAEEIEKNKDPEGSVKVENLSKEAAEFYKASQRKDFNQYWQSYLAATPPGGGNGDVGLGGDDFWTRASSKVLPVLAGLAIFEMLRRLTRSFIKLNEQVVGVAEKFAVYNGETALAARWNRAKEFQRNLIEGEALAKSRTELMKSWNDLKDAAQPLIIAFKELANYILIFLDKIAASAVSVIPTKPGIGQIAATAAGGLTGAAVGAAVGSVVAPGVGTVVGGIAGTVLGTTGTAATLNAIEGAAKNKDVEKKSRDALIAILALLEGYFLFKKYRNDFPKPPTPPVSPDGEPKGKKPGGGKDVPPDGEPKGKKKPPKNKKPGGLNRTRNWFKNSWRSAKNWFKKRPAFKGKGFKPGVGGAVGALGLGAILDFAAPAPNELFVTDRETGEFIPLAEYAKRKEQRERIKNDPLHEIDGISGPRSHWVVPQTNTPLAEINERLERIEKNTSKTAENTKQTAENTEKENERPGGMLNEPFFNWIKEQGKEYFVKSDDAKQVDQRDFARPFGWSEEQGEGNYGRWAGEKGFSTVVKGAGIK